MTPSRYPISVEETLPTLVVLGNTTVPVKVGPERGAFRSKADCVAVETGLLVSEVLSTLPRPTMLFVTPDTVPVNVGEAIGA